jgi:hypothetical protein
MITVRQIAPSDKELLDAAAKADYYHAAAGLTGEHWLNGNSLIYADASGPVLALRTTNVARVDVQFLSQDFKRNARLLVEAFWQYVSVMEKRGVRELIFNTESPAVVRFFCKRFGFRHLGGDTYSLRIRM